MNDNNHHSISDIKYVNHPLIKKNLIEYRSYQDNIVKSARYKNTMIILPTALGKTVISALICADIMYNYKKLKILILAPTKPLVLQHMNSFLSFLQVIDDQKIIMTGKTTPNLRKSIWKNDYIKLIFATPEIVRNDLLQNRINLGDFGLVVFDEAHRAVKDYAYTFIAKKYLESEKNPTILAMTASPGSDSERIEQVCDNLNIEHIEYRNEEDRDVKAYINPINIKWEWLVLPDEYISIATILKSMLNEKLWWLSSRGLLRKKNTDYVFKKDLIELGNILKQNLKYSNPQNQGSLFYAMMTQSAALSLMYCIELIESQGSFSLTTFMKRMENSEGKTHSILLKDLRMIEIKNRLLKNKIVHPKIEYIVDLLKKYNDNNKSISNTKSKVLIFTHYRDTAKFLVDILEQNKIKAFRFVGQANRKDDIGMKQDEQSTILNSFRQGEFNVLIATSIAEEGLDIPQVDLVIFYEPIASEIRYIQRKGRTGRKSMGSVIILAANDTVDARILYASKRRMENMKILLNNIKSKLKPIDRDLPKLDLYTEDELNNLYKVTEKQKKSDSGTLYNEYEDFLSSKYIQKHGNKRIITMKKEEIQHNDLDEDSKVLKKKVERTSRFIYNELLKIYTSQSLQHKSLLDKSYFYDNINNVDPDIIDEALNHLENKRLIKINNNDDTIDLYFKNVSEINFSNNNFKNNNNNINLQGKKKNNGCYYICVEKVISGKAIVLVDGKWHATLNYYDYEGPRRLLKRGSEFKATSELYYDTSGVFCVRIKDVLLM